MNYNPDILKQAALAVVKRSGERPGPDTVVQALLAAEKASKQQKTPYSFNHLVGDWQLCFITGTHKTRQRAGVVLGAGRYVPSLVTIRLSYTASSSAIATDSLELPYEMGQVDNQVQMGWLRMTVSGPVKRLKKNNILAFDFTRLSLQLANRTLYTGNMRGGETSEANFYQTSVGQQAFFNYFLVNETLIAARGRGGGLALWGRQLSQ